jgi:hypothetical protein
MTSMMMMMMMMMIVDECGSITDPWTKRWSAMAAPRAVALVGSQYGRPGNVVMKSPHPMPWSRVQVTEFYRKLQAKAAVAEHAPESTWAGLHPLWSRSSKGPASTSSASTSSSYARSTPDGWIPRINPPPPKRKREEAGVGQPPVAEAQPVKQARRGTLKSFFAPKEALPSPSPCAPAPKDEGKGAPPVAVAAPPKRRPPPPGPYRPPPVAPQPFGPKPTFFSFKDFLSR